MSSNGALAILIGIIVVIIFLLQWAKNSWRRRGDNLQQRANMIRQAEYTDRQQKERDRALLIALLYAINKDKK